MRFVILAFLWTLWACDNGAAQLNHFIFPKFGTVAVGKVGQVSMKELHLEHGTFAGREVIIEGKVVEVGEHGTYIVLSDDTARLLVMTPSISLSTGVKPEETDRIVRILGVVENGKKGLPVLDAMAIYRPTYAAKVPATSGVRPL